MRTLAKREVVDEVGDDARREVRRVDGVVADGGDEPHGVEGIADEAAEGNGDGCAVGAEAGADRDGYGKGKDWHEAKRLHVVLHEDARRAVSCRPQLWEPMSYVMRHLFSLHSQLSTLNPRRGCSDGNLCTAIDAEPPP